MPTGLMQRWKGKVKAHSIMLGSGGLVDSASGLAGKAVAAQALALPVTATANTDFTMSLPPGAAVMSARVYTTTAYTGTGVTIQIGAAAAGSDYVSAVSIKSAGLVSLTLIEPGGASPLSALPAAPNLFVRVAQSGTPTAVGAAVLIVEYMIP